jgi:tRNA pseudouridine13 synthase
MLLCYWLLMVDFAPDPTVDLPYAHGGPPLTGKLRLRPEDFQVDEILGYAASGAGEHAFLHIRKTQLNTLDVARRLAKHAGVKMMAIGFAGLKDKQAVTTQYFSVQLAGKPDPDWLALNDGNLEILSIQRHHRKIRRGTLQGNRFVLQLRDVQGNRAAARQVLEKIKTQGVPNYFGQQRFGREASNLYQAQQWVDGRFKRPKPEQKRMLVSAMRSYLFNQVLAERVEQGLWQTAIAGDVMIIDGTNKQFQVDHPPDEETLKRVQNLEIHPSGPLCGKPSRCLVPTDQAGALEETVVHNSGRCNWIEKLESLNIDAGRRALSLHVKGLNYNWVGKDNLNLIFYLSAGSYATVVVRELNGTT